METVKGITVSENRIVSSQGESRRNRGYSRNEFMCMHAVLCAWFGNQKEELTPAKKKILATKNAKDGIRTRASEEIGALNRRLRPTRPPPHVCVIAKGIMNLLAKNNAAD